MPSLGRMAPMLLLGKIPSTNAGHAIQTHLSYHIWKEFRIGGSHMSSLEMQGGPKLVLPTRKQMPKDPLACQSLLAQTISQVHGTTMSHAANPTCRSCSRTLSVDILSNQSQKVQSRRYRHADVHGLPEPRCFVASNHCESHPCCARKLKRFALAA